jgi:hypothetical protein
MATARQALLNYCAADAAIATGTAPAEVRDLGLVFMLRWIDPAYHDRGGPVGEFTRERKFLHAGGAIAWARRQIFHGKVFGDAVEMETYYRTEYEGKVEEHPHEVIDITLPGFCKWDARDAWGESSSSRTATLGKPTQKCRIEV